MLDEIWVEIIDENGHFIELPFREALAQQQAWTIAEEATLGIKRNQIPFSYTFLPNTPQTKDFCKLAQAIKAVATFDLTPETDQQRYYMRCIQFYWQAKALLLSNKIFKLINDPSKAGGSLNRMLPPTALGNLQLETDVEKAVYDLIVAGESQIRDWAFIEGIPYPFKDPQELLIHILKEQFKANLQNALFNPESIWPNKKNQQQHHRQWLKFFADHFNGEFAIESQYFQVLRTMGWNGYWILALWEQKNHQNLRLLWKKYLKTNRAIIKLFDSSIHWRKGIPYKTKRTNQILSVETNVDSQGYITWFWPS